MEQHSSRCGQFRKIAVSRRKDAPRLAIRRGFRRALTKIRQYTDKF